MLTNYPVDSKDMLIHSNPSLLLTCKYFYEHNSPFIKAIKLFLKHLGTAKGMFEYLDYASFYHYLEASSFYLVVIKDCNEYSLSHISRLPDLNSLFLPNDFGEVRLTGSTILRTYTLGTRLPKELASHNTIIPDEYDSWALASSITQDPLTQQAFGIYLRP